MKTRLKFISSACLLGAAALSSLHAGSLWREGYTDERGMFADKRAKRIGDVVTIIVNENVSLTNTLNLTTNKSNSTDTTGVITNLVNQLVSAIPTSIVGKVLNKGQTNGAIAAPSPSPFTLNGTEKYTGGGQIQNSQTVTATVPVQVTDVLPNGNLVVEGVREISFSKERQFASVHGVIRPYDIQPDNTVQSSNVADAQIQIVSEGTLTDAQKKGWLQRLDDKVNPF